jgi:hypothetical protein
MKSIAQMGMEELGAYVCSKLEEQGIKTVLSGGSCAEIYSHGKYVSDDIDLIDRYNAREGEITNVMTTLGFTEYSRYYIHADTKYFVEFPRGPLGVGDAPVHEIASMEFETGTLRLLTPTDCVKDRLAAYYHWKDEQGLDQALWVSEHNDIDLNAIRQWSEREGCLDKFEIYRQRINA